MLAEKLIATHIPESEGWKFRWSRAVRGFGFCAYNKKEIRLSLRLTLMNDETEVQNTILHEIAHVQAGPRNGHNALWKKFALDLGARPQRCYSGEVSTPACQWTGHCPNCTRVVTRHRRSRIACAVCCMELNHGSYSSRFAFKWRRFTQSRG